MSDGLDPEIAALLSQSETGDSADNAVTDISDSGMFKSPSSGSKETSSSSAGSASVKSLHEVDLSRTEFAPIEKFTNDTPSEIFNDTKRKYSQAHCQIWR